MLMFHPTNPESSPHSVYLSSHGRVIRIVNGTANQELPLPGARLQFSYFVSTKSSKINPVRPEKNKKKSYWKKTCDRLLITLPHSPKSDLSSLIPLSFYSSLRLHYPDFVPLLLQLQSGAMDASGSSSGAPPGRGKRASPWVPRIDPFFPRTDHNPQELKSWARRTGFKPHLSGDTASVLSDQDYADEPQAPARLNLENGIRRGGNGIPRKPEIEPVVGRGRNGAEDGGVEIGPTAPRAEKEKRKVGIEPGGVGIMDEKREAGHEPLLRVKSDGSVRNGLSNGSAPVFPVKPDKDSKEEAEKDEKGVEIDFFSDDQESEGPSGHKPPSDFQSALTDSPGVMLLIFYGIQHYLSLAGSLVFIPLIMVPVMGGTDEETAAVISTMLLVSGVTTIMHSYFGSRLPLVQGSSFVYLAPALVIINSEEYRNLSENVRFCLLSFVLLIVFIIIH
ncbi:hypothetical protein ZIOFF_018740 [Zingiber officinale]|uniref:Nucleobase-ascorbate transporter 11 n=1 Tax=Zingiber officinale TaxID=94328 RepID=A0A8J5H6F0_ZINOF|nr:hypothetical protein ZIOFF_018740 [Zingiber officinale]